MNTIPKRHAELGRQFDWYLPHLKWLGYVWDELKSVEAKRADLSGANLSEADLSEADLSEANLSGADLSEADLSEADLSWANLSGADLSEADLSWANLSGAKGIVSFGPVGSVGRIGYVVSADPEPMVKLGCWWEPLSKTLEKLKAERSPGYVAIVEAAALVLSEQVKS